MRYLRLYENFKIQDIPNFAIDICECPDDKLMEILNYLEKFGKLQFNPQPYTKEKFINHKDTQGRAWCWTVAYSNSFGEPKLKLSGIHTRGWYREDLMAHMINWQKFLKLGLQDSIKYMKREIEIKKMEKETDKYNL